MPRYLVALYFVDEDGTKHFMNGGAYWAESEEDAKECALDNWWDPRLESASCSPCVEVRLKEDDEDTDE